MSTAKTQEIQRTESQELALSAIHSLMDSVPDAGGDGLSILTPILNANSAEDLVGEDASELPDVEMFFDHDLRIEAIVKQMSDQQYLSDERISDYYLIVTAHDLTTGEDVKFSTGAASPSVKLIKLYQFGAFPCTVRFSQAKKQTKRGYYPVNMAVLAVTSRETVNA